MPKKDSFFYFPLCHQLPERTIYFKNKPLPFCARCTGVLIGVFSLPIFHIGLIQPNLLNIVVLSTPSIIDATTQFMEWRDSDNELRIVTGFLLGMGVAGFIVFITRMLVSYLI
ncbi:DUF2085 domain-containing protein [Methanobacterium alcaliphilum]|uniref:DUF2085 domain-containing protein n=1 Tax=Methanobacterium alcaliphilum TaxID=392018 RepID=UPI00200AA9A9|nr:DUF2085 domain-containing protein [Methanobacterium alcaliphilum]MCK9150578.1 DUF2085 domain-containing protein [Methanobacterium alcaliphilum]